MRGEYRHRDKTYPTRGMDQTGNGESVYGEPFTGQVSLQKFPYNNSRCVATGEEAEVGAVKAKRVFQCHFCEDAYPSAAEAQWCCPAYRRWQCGQCQYVWMSVEEAEQCCEQKES